MTNRALKTRPTTDLVIEGTATQVAPTTGTDLVVVPPAQDTAPAPETTEDPLAGKSVLFVANPIQKALFEDCILPEMRAGKWSGKSQANLVKPWLEVVVVVAKEGQKLGRNFDAQKSNWNVNDSNWTNPEANYRRLSAAARAANQGKEMAKKALIGELVDLKGIFQMRAD